MSALLCVAQGVGSAMFIATLFAIGPQLFPSKVTIILVKSKRLYNVDKIKAILFRDFFKLVLEQVTLQDKLLGGYLIR